MSLLFGDYGYWATSIHITEIKSAMTYHPEFEKGIKYFSEIFKNRVINKQVIYCGELENPVGEIKLLNYRAMSAEKIL